MKIYENFNTESLLGEIWKDVRGLEGEYQISSFGRVKSLSRRVNTWNGYKTIPEKILKQSIRNNYLRACNINVHRMVAMAFIPTKDFSLYVNHINGNKFDNRVENLEWCTPKENNLHAWKTGLCNEETRNKMREKAKLRTGEKNSCWRGYIDILNLEGKFIIQVKTLKEAEIWIKENTEYKKADKGNISLVCNNKLSKMYGFKFRYNKENENE